MSWPTKQEIYIFVTFTTVWLSKKKIKKVFFQFYNSMVLTKKWQKTHVFDKNHHFGTQNVHNRGKWFLKKKNARLYRKKVPSFYG